MLSTQAHQGLVVVWSLSCVWFFVIPWTVVRQASLSMGFSRQECWRGLPFPSPGDLLHLEIEPMSPELAGGFFTAEPPGKPSASQFPMAIFILCLLHLSTLWPHLFLKTVSSTGGRTLPSLGRPPKQRWLFLIIDPPLPFFGNMLGSQTQGNFGRAHWRPRVRLQFPHDCAVRSGRETTLRSTGCERKWSAQLLDYVS